MLKRSVKSNAFVIYQITVIYRTEFTATEILLSALNL